MPCSSGYDDHGSCRTETVYRDNPQQQRRIDYLTRLLCYACDQIDHRHLEDNQELSKWYEDHLAKDAEMHAAAMRIAAITRAKDEHTAHLASIRTRLQGQLTDEEKEALGI